MVCQDTLRIKHLPKELSDAQKEDFMRHFGAVKVKVITSKAKAKSVVFAKFPNTDVAKNVMTRLHQLNVLNCRLSVEYAETDILQGAPSVKKITDLKELPDQKFFRNFINNINAFNDSVGFHQPPPSHLKYNYPKANRSTINNIAHALATVPRFYTQVLHLMNKMNLPPPFAMPEPPVRVIQPSQNPVPQKPAENPPEKRKESSSESEIESDGESNKNTNIIPQKRTLPQKKVVKRPKFIKQTVAPANVSTKPPEKPEDIFEMVEVQIPKKIELRVMPELPPEPQKVKPVLEQVRKKSPDARIKQSIEPKLVEKKDVQSSKPEVSKKSIIKIPESRSVEPKLVENNEAQISKSEVSKKPFINLESRSVEPKPVVNKDVQSSKPEVSKKSNITSDSRSAEVKLVGNKDVQSSKPEVSKKPIIKPDSRYVEPKLVGNKDVQNSKPEVSNKPILKPEVQQKLAPKKDIPLVSIPPAKKHIDMVSDEDQEIELLKQKVIESMSSKKNDEIVKDKVTESPSITMLNKNNLLRKLAVDEEENKSKQNVIEKTSQMGIQNVLVKDVEKRIHICADVKLQEGQQKQDKPQEMRQELPLQKVDLKVIESTNDLQEPTSPDDEYPCISLEELAANQVTDLSVMPVFKNYTPGEPTNKLYIKNCAKTVVVQDLEYIYNRYREDPTEDKSSEFNIRLMQEGRMKGQAFVTLDSIKMAEKAVKETNGFILKDKPLVVVFGKAGKKKK